MLSELLCVLCFVVVVCFVFLVYILFSQSEKHDKFESLAYRRTLGSDALVFLIL